MRRPHRAVGTIAVVAAAWISASAAAQSAPTVPSAFERAAGHFKAEQYDLAAPLFHEAYKADPRPVFLFNAALAEQRAGQLEAARRHFEAVLAIEGVHPKIAERSRAALAEIDQVSAKPVASEPPPAVKPQGAPPAAPSPPPRVKQEEPPQGWRSPVGWGGVGVGVLLAGVGGWMVSVALADDQALRDRLTRVEGKVAGLDSASYRQERDDIASRWNLGVGLAGLGVLAGATGVWMLATAPDGARVTLWQDGRGLSLKLAF